MGKRGPKRVPIEKRFWGKVNKTKNCWLWTARVNDFGYGVIGAGGEKNGWLRAHRVAWELTFGKIPAGLYVLHNCDNPACVNPGHLHLGTLKDNSREMVERNRNSTIFKKGDSFAILKRWAKHKADKQIPN